MNHTKIPWTDLSWNPVTGCRHACPYCYARALSRRFGRSFEPTFHPDRLAQPGLQKKAKKIFVCSMADLMGAWVPAKWITAVIGVIRDCPHHIFQLLTKAPERYHEFAPWPRNAWLGASATNQAQWDRAEAALSTLGAGAAAFCRS